MKTYDYCIIGTDLDGLTFADTVLRHSDATIAIIESSANPSRSRRRDMSHVSRALTDDRIGLASYTLRDWRSEFHSAHINRPPTPVELHAYRNHVLDHCLTQTGRLDRLTNIQHLGNGRFRALSRADVRLPSVRRRVVNTGQGPDHLPKSGGHRFTVASSVQVVKPRVLRAHAEMKHRAFDQYCVIGAGSVGTEMMLALIDLDIPINKIKWVKPREGWMLLAPLKSQSPPARLALQKEALITMANAPNAADLSRRFEHLGMLARVSDDQIPTHFLPHMVSQKDAEKLRRVRGVVRKGHVHAISEIGMILSHGAVPMPHRTLYLDCTGSGSHAADAPPIFAEKSLQMSQARLSSPSFSAALIGAIETTDLTIAQKNALCAPISGSNLALCFLKSLLNHHAWFYNREIRRWLETCRLDPILQSAAQQMNGSEQIPAELSAIRTILPRAIVNLESLVEQTGALNPLRA